MAGSDRQEQIIAPIIDNEQLILRKKSQILESFRSFVNSSGKSRSPQELMELLVVVLDEETTDEETRGDLGSALINASYNFDLSLKEEFKDEDAGEELITFLSDLYIEFGTDLKMSYVRDAIGDELWTNVETTVGKRADVVVFNHELIKCFDNKVEFRSTPSDTISLVNHFTSQVLDAYSTIGQDVINEVPEEGIDKLVEKVEELREKKENYEE